MISADNRLQNRDANNFDFLRFLAAALVMLGHSFAFLGLNYDPLVDLTGYVHLAPFCVSIFFFMSGVLVTGSWFTSSSSTTFLMKRCLRILPGLFVCIATCVLIVGPLTTSLPLGQYLASTETYRFFMNVLWPGYAYFLPDVFGDNPLRAVNGSLWTLPLEYRCYILILVAGAARLLTPKRFPIVAGLALGAILWPYVVAGWHGTDLTKGRLAYGDCYYVYFLLGMAAYLYRQHLPINRWLGLLAAALLLGTLSTGILGYAVSFISIPYLVIYLAQARIPELNRWGSRGDLSYGMYIYAFPIQQLVVHYLGVGIGVAALFVLSTAITIGVAYLSWHLIERPALALSWGWRRRPLTNPFLVTGSVASPETSVMNTSSGLPISPAVSVANRTACSR